MAGLKMWRVNHPGLRYLGEGSDSGMGEILTGGGGLAEPRRAKHVSWKCQRSKRSEPGCESSRDFGSADQSSKALREATGPELDLSRPAHRRALHQWLNAWGCRIRTVRTGETDPFDVAIARWWKVERRSLRAIDAPLAQLSDDDLRILGAAYARLSRRSSRSTRTARLDRWARPPRRRRCTHLKPSVGDAVGSGHRRSTARRSRRRCLHESSRPRPQRWAQSLLAESGLDEVQLVAELGRPGATLAKVLDEYCYVRYTLGH